MKKPGYLKNPENGRVLPWTQILENRGNMIPCDADGNPLRVDDITKPAVAKTVDPGNPEYRKQLERKYRDEFENVNAHRKSLLEAKYDGVAGVLPEWVPPAEHRRFDKHRKRLQDIYSHEEVLRFLALRQNDYPGRMQIVDVDPRKRSPDDSPLVSMKTELWDSIDYLVFLKNAVDAGEKEGLLVLAGKNAARGYKSVSSGRSGGKAKREIYTAEKERIKKIAAQIRSNGKENLSQRELARRVVKKAYPDLNEELVRKKADSIRRLL
jgi:hypothetical protein